ncbi:MAG TPA: ROK family protein [Hanamia sp.]|nr:ROK family protein [Hanamia sp.]
MDDYKAAGVDIGGSHITVGMVDLKKRRLVENSLLRKHVNSKGSAEEILDTWVEVIEKLFSNYPFIQKKIGIAMPGPFDYEEGICLIKGVDKFENLFNFNIKKLLAEKLKNKAENILMLNDASCFLKGEVFGGAAVNCDNVIGITLGTGLGSARFHSGQTFEGDLYFSPFKDGVAEDYLSGRWLLKRYKEITGRTAKNVKELVEKISEDSRIKILFAEFGKNLGEVLYIYAKKHKCETIVIGGNIANAWELFIPETKNILGMLPKRVEIKKAELGEESALIGAASLWR